MYTAVSCETLDLDLTQDPNLIRVENADPEFLLNALQLDYHDFISNSEFIISRLTRISPMGMSSQEDGSYNAYLLNYERTTAKGGNILSETWKVFYVNMLRDIELLKEQARADTSGTYNFNLAVANIIEAHCASLLVDFYGDIPYSEGGNFLNIRNPKLDKGEDVYEACFNLLNEAIAILGADPAPINTKLTDLFYDGDATKWLKFANSLKLRMYKNTGNTSAFNAIISSGNFISESSDNMEFSYGAYRNAKSNRYRFDYPNTDNDPVSKSNWLMNTMQTKNDPRIRYYFYRQTGETPGIDIPANTVLLPCSDETPPGHYSGFAYCAVENGYIGRSHGSTLEPADLITDRPGNSIATLYGVYPFGGLFDNDRFQEASNVNFPMIVEDTGNGVLPILKASDIDFWRGQMASSSSEKMNFLRSAMEKHIAKVTTFISQDTSVDPMTETTIPSTTDIENYITDITNSFASASGDAKEDIFAEQYFISLYGNGIEAYNYYRKTGYPTTLSPTWSTSPGTFPRSLAYPETELNNTNIPNGNKPTSDQVFWDTNPASPTFPIAN
ncbi:hypothetical protein GCM10022396_09040 [Flavivirga amylovorans]